MDPREHWERVYSDKTLEQCSWYQRVPERSLDLITRSRVSRTDSILDVGGGDSLLADHLAARQYRNVTVVDVSLKSLARAKQRLGDMGLAVRYVQADVRALPLRTGSIAIWHDRAVFHFLSHPPDREVYIQQVRRVVRPGGHVIVATFADDGPTHCSGLPVVRYASEALRETFGTGFRLVESDAEVHRTPAGAEQRFTYCWCRYEPGAASAA
jgi:ubiquinone/menaquinone biosynthesis C-methylase UbiE